MSRIPAACWLLLLLCLSVPAHGRDAAPVRPLDLSDLGAPAFANFSARDGLPYTVIVGVVTDRDGFVWAATPIGVFRYDGRRWSGSDDPAMAHSVDTLFVDHQGTLWAGFRNDGLARYDGHRWHAENLRTGLPSQQIRRFTETVDARGARTLWAVTWDKGLLRHRDGRWIADAGNPSLPRGAILSMAQTQQLGGHPRQWAGTGTAGLWYRDEGARDWQRWLSEGIDSTQIEYLLPVERDGHEELWATVFGLGLLRISDAGERRWTRGDGSLPTAELYDLAATPLPGGERAIWVSSRSGLLRIRDGGTHDGSVQVFDRRHGLPSDAIRGLDAWRSPDGKAVLWLATEAGVSRTIPGASAWTTASLLGSRSIGVFGVLVEPDGHGGERLWVGSSDDGLALFQDGRWHRYTHDNGSLPGTSVEMIVATIAADGTRTHWIGSGGGQLLRVRLRDDGAPVFETIATPWRKATGEGLRDTLVRNFHGHAEQWIATRQSGIWRWRDGHWTSFRPAAARGQWGAGRLLETRDADGGSWLWASTNQGLARFDGTRWELFGRDAGIPDDFLIGLDQLPDPQGRTVLWAGSSGSGIVRVDVTDPRHPRVLANDLPPAPDATAYGALADSAGRVYICTNSGVQQLTPRKDGRWESRVFNRRDGMVHDECNTNAQFIDAHDRFWTGTLGGLTVYDPGREAHDTQPKPLRLTGLRVDGKPQAGPVLRVPAHATTVEVEFALLSWTRESESRFRTWLVGLEEAPGEWSPQATRSYSALPPGDYTLRIEARDHAGNRSTPIELPIEVAAQWWQHRWTAAAAVLALVLLGYTASLARTRVLRAQRSQLEQRVAARTAELDAANARLVELSYRDALTGLANRRRLLERLERLPVDSAPGTATALVFVDVDHFKDYNDRFGHQAGDEALRSVATLLLRCAPDDALVARYGGEEFACLLPGTGTAVAAALAERMRVAVEACEIASPGVAGTRKVTISAGVVSARVATIEQANRLLHDADLALYQAKRDGRNRVRTQDDATQG
jgi:diguanylate cyclase (GGDEF)-like protein